MKYERPQRYVRGPTNWALLLLAFQEEKCTFLQHANRSFFTSQQCPVIQPFLNHIVPGSIRRSDASITADYDAIDRSDPPLFVNNTRTDVVVAAGKDARLECRVRNLGDRVVRVPSLQDMLAFA